MGCFIPISELIVKNYEHNQTTIESKFVQLLIFHEKKTTIKNACKIVFHMLSLHWTHNPNLMF